MPVFTCFKVQKVNCDIHRRFYCFCDLDLDPMTLIYELDMYLLKYVPKINFLGQESRLSKLRALQTHRQT